MTKLGFKSSKIRGESAKNLLNQRNSLILCSIIILICSISIWFVEGISRGLNTLFYNYSSLHNQSQQNFGDENVVLLTGSSFKGIQLSFYSNPTYIVAGGDVMLSRNIGYFARKHGYDRIFKEGNYNPLNKFEKCNSNNCLLFLNLESLFCEPDNDIQMGGFDFRSNPNNIKTLMQYRGDKPLLLALPNNHFSNGGYLGLTTTKELLDKNNIFYVGAGLTEDESRKIFKRKNNGINFCLGAYSYDGKSARIRGGLVYWNSINEEVIKADLQRMKDMRCDIKIISLHRGSEYRFSPNNWQRNLAHSFIDSGADLILGGHSHIPGEFEIYNGKYIFYSLGNFIFDQGWGKRATGAEFNYFYDADLKRNNVPTYISMLIGLKFEKKLMKGIDVKLDQIEFNSTTDGLFSTVGEETRNNLLEKINRTNLNL